LDEGDHWQSLQLNLPVTSVRDLAIHDDDLIVATHGRSFWILDNITPLRQASDAAKANAFRLYHPATAFRIDNDSFPGTPLPPEEPTAENPPAGAVIDYLLKSPARNITLEITDSKQKLVRRFSSEDKHPEKHPPAPIAERWFPKPEALQTTAGMHRFVWNLVWASSGSSPEDESESRAPSGPKVVPGNYTVKLTVNGESQTQSLKVVMDPRSPATPEILQEQFQLGQNIFNETIPARRALAEINQVQKQLVDAKQKLGEQNAALTKSLAAVDAEIHEILTQPDPVSGQPTGLQDAYAGLASALGVVESGDRAIPSQAIALYQESSERVKAGVEAWSKFKETKLPHLNQELREANLSPISISEIEQPVEFLLSR
jgi:hypothetical protein